MRAAKIALFAVSVAFAAFVCAIELDLEPQTRNWLKFAAVVVMTGCAAMVMPIPRRADREEDEVIRTATLQPEFLTLLRRLPVGSTFRIAHVDRAKGVVRVDVEIPRGEQFALGATWSGPVFQYDVDARERVD